MAEGPDNFAVSEFSHQADDFTVTLGAFFEQEFAPITFDYRHLSSAQNSSSLSRPGVFVCVFVSWRRTLKFISFESQQHAARRKDRKVRRFIISRLSPGHDNANRCRTDENDILHTCDIFPIAAASIRFPDANFCAFVLGDLDSLRLHAYAIPSVSG